MPVAYEIWGASAHEEWRDHETYLHSALRPVPQLDGSPSRDSAVSTKPQFSANSYALDLPIAFYPQCLHSLFACVDLSEKRIDGVTRSMYITSINMRGRIPSKRRIPSVASTMSSWRQSLTQSGQWKERKRMDWSWLSQVLAWIVAVNNTISNFAAVLGFLTIVTAGTAYILRQAFSDPFGDTYRKPPRYEKFFLSLAQKVRSKRRSLVAQDIRGRNFCQFLVKGTSKAEGMIYYVYFVQGTTPQVYLSLSDSNGAWLYKRIWDRRDLLEKRLGLTRRFLRKPVEGVLDWDPKDIDVQGRIERKVVVQYPRPVAIDDDARILKQLRKWAARELVALQRAVDEILADTSKSSAPVPAGALAATPDAVPARSA